MITSHQLKDLGFEQSYGNTIDNGDYYIVYTAAKGAFTLDCTNTHDLKSRQVKHQYFELNGETLTGKVTCARLKNLIDLI